MQILSIVTVHLNDFDGLLRTAQSLLPLIGSPDLEWIVIDGASDQRLDPQNVMAQVRQQASILVSEPDKGIYDAMNKGTRAANGEYILYLNAGDELHREFDLELLQQKATSSDPDMVWGRSQFRYEDGFSRVVKTRPRWMAWYGLPVNHQAIFFRRQILGDTPYDAFFPLAADYDLVCRLLSKDASLEVMKLTVCIYHRGGSADIQGDKYRSEENEIRMKYFPISPILGDAIIRFKEMNSNNPALAKTIRFWRRWI